LWFALSRRLIVRIDLPKHWAATSRVAHSSAFRIASRSSALIRDIDLCTNVVGAGAINDRGAAVVVSVFEVSFAASLVLVGEPFKPTGYRLSVGHDDLLMKRGSPV